MGGTETGPYAHFVIYKILEIFIVDSRKISIINDGGEMSVLIRVTYEL